MADTKPQPEHWAVLIGVGVNISSSGPGNRGGGSGSIRDRSLRGAVQDIISVAEYLKTGHGDGGSESGSPAALDITSLNATKKSTAAVQPRTQQNQSAVPGPAPVVVTAIETPEYLPTRDNVISSFQRILKLSRPGSQVYIHYSGHGTKRKYDNAVALVLVNPANNFQAEYLYGTVLRSAIHAMIRKGLSVTLVLDCCFSGRVLREDEGDLTEAQRLEGVVDIRYMEHDPELDTNYHDPFDDEQPDSVRGVEVGNLERLLDPDGYTILSACGPDEYASELEFEGGIRRGALSYFLVDSLSMLRKRGIITTTTTGGLSHHELYQHLRSQFHACIPDQTPMLYGNRGFLFFFGGFTTRQQQDFQDSEMAVSAQRDITDGSLVLNAGQAHGVHKGDEYILTPSPFLEGGRDTTMPTTTTSYQPTSITVRVEQVDCIRSRIVPVDPKHMERIKKGSVWRARLVTALSPRKVHILLDSDVLDREGIAREAAAKSCCHFIQVVLLSSSESTEQHHHIHDASPIFRVTMNATARDEYEIRDAAGKKLRNLAVISAIQDDDGGGRHKELIDTLNHIAKYKFLEGIDNHMPCPSFEASFSLRTNTDITPEKDGYYVIKHGEELTLTFENLTTDRTLYLAIFTFTEFWQVRNLVSEKGEDACMAVLPRGHGDGDGESDGKEELSLMPEVPEELREKGQRQTEDVVKVFVTSQSTLFPGLFLPRLGGRKDSNDSNSSRGDAELDNSVERFLKELTTTTTTGDGNGDPWRVQDSGSGSGWTTRNYLIRTVV